MVGVYVFWLGCLVGCGGNLISFGFSRLCTSGRLRGSFQNHKVSPSSRPIGKHQIPMSKARDSILATIRRANGSFPQLTKDAISWPQPRLNGGLAENFVQSLKKAGAVVEKVSAEAGIGGCVSRYLQREQLPSEVVVSDDEVLKLSDWPELVTVHRGRPATRDDKVSVTGAVHGIAETGTLVLVSGEQNPTTLNFLPDHHIVVLRESSLVANTEDMWGTLRERFPIFPRSVNLISGPSKTADVEQTLQLGAHGPRRLLVILVKGEKIN